MAILSFIAGLPSFWIVSRTHIALSSVVQLTSGLLLSTCINIVLPEAIAHLSKEKLNSPAFGPQILIGFITLYSIDIFSASFSKYIQANINNNLNNYSLDLANDTSFVETENQTSNISTIKSYLFSVISNSTTLGLLLHCLTDGVLLTTSLLSKDSKSENSSTFLLILSLFLHKLPASFSLTSILLNENLKTTIVLFHLFLFAISAPVGAWLTYIVAKMLNYSNFNDSNGFILLFSTGAFLYVSFHAFISCHKHNSNLDKLEHTGFNVNWDYLITIVGMIMPILVGFLHDD
jgi:zinc transporter 9